MCFLAKGLKADILPSARVGLNNPLSFNTCVIICSSALWLVASQPASGDHTVEADGLRRQQHSARSEVPNIQTDFQETFVRKSTNRAEKNYIVLDSLCLMNGLFLSLSMIL